jgi:hypothetical protein
MVVVMLGKIPSYRRLVKPVLHFAMRYSTTPSAEREHAYDRNSSIGRLDKGPDEAQARGWTFVT